MIKVITKQFTVVQDRRQRVIVCDGCGIEYDAENEPMPPHGWANIIIFGEVGEPGIDMCLDCKKKSMAFLDDILTRGEHGTSTTDWRTD